MGERVMNLSNLRYFFVGSAVLLAFSGPVAAAGSAEALLQALAGCAAEADGPARLACYDRLAPQVKDALANPAPPAVASAPPAPASAQSPAVAAAQPPAAAPPRSPTKEEQKSWFGFGNLFGSSQETQTKPEQFGEERTVAKQQEVEAKKQEAEAQGIDSIAAKLTEYAMTPVGKFIVFLDNGQVWRELPSEDSNVLFKHDMAKNTVEIERGLLGSYILHLNGGLRGYKVVRVK